MCRACQEFEYITSIYQRLQSRRDAGPAKYPSVSFLVATSPNTELFERTRGWDNLPQSIFVDGRWTCRAIILRVWAVFTGHIRSRILAFSIPVHTFHSAVSPNGVILIYSLFQSPPTLKRAVGMKMAQVTRKSCRTRTTSNQTASLRANLWSGSRWPEKNARTKTTHVPTPPFLGTLRSLAHILSTLLPCANQYASKYCRTRSP